MVELLAPAGDLKSFYTAINSGADAVYLGLSNFNARMKAENFNASNIREIVRYAHFYGSKIYVTVNTIVKDSEMKELVEMVKDAYLAGVDAFIVQDIGVCSVLLKSFPDIVLHASTQMGIHNLYGAKVAENLGVKRIVLSRETKLEDIKQIKANTNLEIEYFIQGALCIAFSGNCYLSSKEQRASGNRGECKQLCRLPYEAMLDGKVKKGFLLSARDLSLKNTLKELIESGVTSFKIEGRMRREGYVAEAVSVYRDVLDSIIKDENDVTDSLILKKAFNRGEYLGRAYLDENIINVVETRYNNHIGVKIGKVLDVKPFKGDLFEVKVTSTHPLIKGDGVKFFYLDKEQASIGLGDPISIGDNKYKFVTKTKCQKDWDLYLTLDFAEEQLYLSKKMLLNIDMVISANIGEPLSISAKYNNIIVTMTGDVVEEAKSAPMSKDEIITQVSKVQDDGFVLNHIDVSSNNVFIPKSKINSLRREVVSKLKEEIIKSNESLDRRVDENYIASLVVGGKTTQKITRYTLVDEKNIVSAVNIIISPSVYSEASIKTIISNYQLDESNLILQLPIISNHKDLEVIKKLLSKFSGIKTLLVENIYGLYFIQKGYKVIAGEGLNIANSYSVQTYKDLGVKAISLSKEYFLKDDVTLINAENVIVIDNEIPLMTFANCFVQTLYECDCNHCRYKGDIDIKRESHYYKLKRVVVSRCYFRLYSK